MTSIEEESTFTLWSTSKYTPVYLSCIAGASTCIGAAVVFLHPKTSNESSKRQVSNGTMSFSLALAGSVMITVSVVSIGSECLQSDEDGSWIEFGSLQFWQRFFCFSSGCFIYVLLSKCAFPEPEEIIATSILASSDAVTRVGESFDSGEREDSDVENTTIQTSNKSRSTTVPSRRNNRSTITKTSSSSSLDNSSHEQKTIITTTKNKRKDQVKNESKNTFLSWTKGNDLETTQQKRAWRLAMLLFLSLLLHNFPEGLAVAASALESPSLGLTVTIGIMIHNIPEGIAIAIPCLAARPQSPWLSFFSSKYIRISRTSWCDCSTPFFTTFRTSC
mmetsp:Transcript_32422/g.48318  ORF Transcript_32422/g.48318 Transcript_32422/m.48318 type:complete len:333 (-) Transcript_32422:289-1287(-)